MSYVVETKLEDDGQWFVVIDTEKSRVLPKSKVFETEDQATSWAQSNLEKVPEGFWRVVEAENES